MWKIEKTVSKGDYNYALVKSHPNATKNGYVLYHRIVVENHLGRILNSDEVVHHINGNKKDNRIENLQVMNASEHAVLHAKKNIKRFVLLRCPNCKKEFELEYRKIQYKNNKYGYFCSRRCNGTFSNFAQFHSLTMEMNEAISVNILAIYYKIV